MKVSPTGRPKKGTFSHLIHTVCIEHGWGEVLSLSEGLALRVWERGDEESRVKWSRSGVVAE